MIIYFIIAFVGGFISLFSPCSGALLPTYFAISFKKKHKIFISTIVFALGIFTISYPIIAGATYAFNLTQNFGTVIYKIVGVLFFVFAILTLFTNLLKSKFSYLESLLTNKKTDYKFIYVAGIIAGLSLGSCVGPVLGAIITLSSTLSNGFLSFLLILTYILGLVLPLYLMSSELVKFEWLTKLFTKGKLFSISIKNYKFYLHSTNLFLATIWFLFGWLYFNHQGSIFKIFNAENIFDLQYLLLKLLN